MHGFYTRILIKHVKNDDIYTTYIYTFTHLSRTEWMIDVHVSTSNTLYNTRINVYKRRCGDVCWKIYSAVIYNRSKQDVRTCQNDYKYRFAHVSFMNMNYPVVKNLMRLRKYNIVGFVRAKFVRIYKTENIVIYKRQRTMFLLIIPKRKLSILYQVR